MKNISLIWNAILTLVVGFLVYNHFNGSSTGGAASNTKGGGGNIVYVNTDSLLTNFNYYKEITKGLDQQEFKLQNDLAGKERSLQNEAAFFQQRVQQGGMTEEQAQTTYAQLQKKGADLQRAGQVEAQKIMAERGKKTEELLTKIQEFLKEYNKSNPYEMVIGYSKGGGVLYAKESLDITAKVIEGLNNEYKDKKPAAADSTKK